MAKVEVRNLNKTYSPKVIPVKDVSLEISDGEFLTLLGPSGCGKSTTLRMIAGLEQPTRGHIKIGDRDVTNVRPGDRNIAMVFQSYALYPHMTVYENLASGLKLKKVPKAEIDQRIQRSCGVLGLEPLMDRKPGQLSGGQRQRVALGRALVRSPDVFLLDEPLSNLDALLRERVRADIKQLFESQNVPVVYVTHDQTEAMTLSTKVAVLNEGLIQQLAPPAQIYMYPANEFVAGFVGSPQMNLMRLKTEGNSVVLGHSKIRLPELSSTPAEVTLGIRPENVRVALPQDTQIVKGKIFLMENLGMQNLISIRVDGAETHIIRALLPHEQGFEGEQVTLVLPMENIHWFDATSGDRLSHRREVSDGNSARPLNMTPEVRKI